MPSRKIVILAGGWSGEREVSLAGGEQCAQALKKAGHKVVLLDPAREQARLIELAPELDAALIVLHGTYGEDGRIQGFLDCLGLPYQGAGVAGSVRAIDKVISKELFRQAGIKTPKDVVLKNGTSFDAAEVLERLGGSVMVKPARQGSTLGLTPVKRPQEMAPALKTAFELDETVLVEERLRGRELTCGVLETLAGELIALPLVEIRPKTCDFFDYQAKYTPGCTDEICPAPVEADITRQAQEAALTAHRVLGLAHYSRTDMFESGGEICVLETNTIPGMGATSLLPQAAAAAGLDMPALLDRLIELALRDRGR
ncbi:MAG: D-alanine--D-alanine ligase [Deltaproteobacteria bacterium]|nr:D-alanine--D-alanine ligase [Deltaproteobacteria bacterium]